MTKGKKNPHRKWLYNLQFTPQGAKYTPQVAPPAGPGMSKSECLKMANELAKKGLER